jgi:hypothetical protein
MHPDKRFRDQRVEQLRVAGRETCGEPGFRGGKFVLVRDANATDDRDTAAQTASADIFM